MNLNEIDSPQMIINLIQTIFFLLSLHVYNLHCSVQAYPFFVQNAIAHCAEYTYLSIFIFLWTQNTKSMYSRTKSGLNALTQSEIDLCKVVFGLMWTVQKTHTAHGECVPGKNGFAIKFDMEASDFISKSTWPKSWSEQKYREHQAYS